MDRKTFSDLMPVQDDDCVSSPGSHRSQEESDITDLESHTDAEDGVYMCRPLAALSDSINFALTRQTVHLDWPEVCRQEQEFIQEQRRLRGMQQLQQAVDSKKFSVAFSGGGMRAAAFQAGILWRLGQSGRLGDIEHLVAVSGGAYVVSAFGSTLASSGIPQEDVNRWYLRCVSRTICRMQRNVGYLIRDIRKGHVCSGTDDGSSKLPPILDGPAVVLIVLISMLINPVTFVTVYLLPFTEGLSLFEGASMRAAWCAGDSRTTILIFSSWGSLFNIAESFVYVVVCAFALWVFSQVRPCQVHHRRGDQKIPVYAQLMFSIRAAATRAAFFLFLLLVIICGAVIIQASDYSSEDSICREYIRDRADWVVNTTFPDDFFPHHPCGDLIHGLPWFASPHFEKYFDHGELEVMRQKIGVTAWESWVDNLEKDARKTENSWIGKILRAWIEFGLEFSLLYFQHYHRQYVSSMLGLISIMLAASLILNAFVNGILLWTLSILGPFVAILVTGNFVQYRIFGPMTKQYYFRVLNLLPWANLGRWRSWLVVSFCIALVIILFYHHLHALSHNFYCRSLRKAFFDGGEDKDWSQMRNQPFSPFLLFTGTVTDFRRPGENSPISEIFMSSLHTGSERTGFVLTPGWRSLAKSAALAAAASDAFIIGMLDRVRYRFWLEFLNLRMGDYMLFERQPLQLVNSFNVHAYVKDQPFFLYGIIPLICQTAGLLACGVAIFLFEGPCRCSEAKAYYWFYILINATTLALSFFAFLPPFEMFLHSPAIRHLHMAMRYYHQAEHAPSLIYVTDGGVQDCTGVLQLLIRRSERILLALAASDPDDDLAVLRRTMQQAAAEDIASFYDPTDPRRGAEHVLDEFKGDMSKCHFVIGILYQQEGADPLPGRLIVVKNRLPPVLAKMPPERPLSEDDIMDSPEDGSSSEFEPRTPRWSNLPLLQEDLAGCCCDCCHVYGCNFGPKFPNLSNANQCLTPALFSSLCRLGYRLSADAVRAVGEHGLTEAWEDILLQ